MDYVIGAYLDGGACGGNDQALGGRSIEAIARIVPDGALLHVLPFWPSSGDGGFAPNSWSKTDPRKISWEEINSLAKRYRLIVDGIFNHVGIGHPWFRHFCRRPDANARLFHAYKTDLELPSPRAPRGGSALRSHTLFGHRWLIWQTFDSSAVDLNLDNPLVLRRIARQLRKLGSVGLWGIRLDAPAYYGKRFEGPIRHSVESYRLARIVGKMVCQAGLRLYPQLDADLDARSYFQLDSPSTPVVDFTFPAQLFLALATETSRDLVDHLKETEALGRSVIRPIRTHDGILLKSTLMSDAQRTKTLEAARAIGVEPRWVEGFPYEINSSLPHLLAKDLSYEDTMAEIELAIAISLATPGIPYLYLPAIVGFKPENILGTKNLSDPRALNRAPLPASLLDSFFSSKHSQSISRLLQAFHMWPELDKQASTCLKPPSIETLGESGIRISRLSEGIEFFANLSRSRSLACSPLLDHNLLAIGSLDGGILPPRSYFVTFQNPSLQGENYARSGN